MLFLYELIKKSLLLRNFSFATFYFDPNATIKASSSINTLPKTSAKRWNQTDLGYFDPHLDKVYGEDKIVLVEKDIYYKNIIFFIQHLQSLVIF